MDGAISEPWACQGRRFCIPQRGKERAQVDLRRCKSDVGREGPGICSMSPRSGEAGTRNEPPQHTESTQASTKDVVDGHRGHQRWPEGQKEHLSPVYGTDGTSPALLPPTTSPCSVSRPVGKTELNHAPNEEQQAGAGTKTSLPPRAQNPSSAKPCKPSEIPTCCQLPNSKPS